MAMHLASMVHGSAREREPHDRHFQHHQQQQQQQQPTSTYYPPQSQPPRGYPVPASVAPSPYAPYPQSQPADYHYQHQSQRRPQSPPSPPAEEQKPSLPSISSLLGIADGEKASSDTAGQSPKSQPQQQPSPQLRQEPQRRVSSQVPLSQHHQSEHRPEQAHALGPTAVSNPRMTLPPTPPMHPDSVVDGNQSPSAASTHSATSAPYFLGQSLNNMEPSQQRQVTSTVPPMKREPAVSQQSMSPYGNNSTYGQSPYSSSPGAASATSFYSPETHSYNGVGMYSQRPLPSNFQPQTMPLPVPAPSGNGSNPWQHHHYISASSQSAFPQSQDRYICSTCNKAFSRPSSLRIHSHSHTGEKPYKCPQPGCGKAFSVRSNMKRHERGCHAATNSNITT